MSRLIKTLFKIGTAAAAVFYLIYTDRLDADKITLLYRKPVMTSGIILLWFLLILPMTVKRFQLFAGPFGVQMPFGKALALTMIGNFFNTALPGAVSGDVVKGYYLRKSAPEMTKTDVLTVVLIDRAVGLIGLIFIGTVGLVSGISSGVYFPPLLVFFLLCLPVGAVVFYAVIYFMTPGVVSKIIFPFDTDVRKGKKEGIRRFAVESISRLSLYRKHPKVMLNTFLLSCGVHLISVSFFLIISQAFYGYVPDILRQTAVIPPGLMIVALPVSPAGVGVGHAGFEFLYRMAGLENGANIFNIFIILQILMSLTGIFFYVRAGKKTVPVSALPDNSNK